MSTITLENRSPRTYKYNSTKEYVDKFPCAYRQWKADSHCNVIHGVHIDNTKQIVIVMLFMVTVLV